VTESNILTDAAGLVIFSQIRSSRRFTRHFEMKVFSHAPDALYLIMEGVRRAKSAQMFGHTQIRAEVLDPQGQSLGEGDLPIDALRSPKTSIRRVTAADETRWHRAVAGAKQAVLPYPPITVQPSGERGTRIEDVGFDFGGNP
jgi:hypothetical protein